MSHTHIPTHPVKQKPGDMRCVACVAALAAGRPPEEFEAYVAQKYGHKTPPYNDIHLYDYLLTHKLICGLAFTPESISPESDTIIQLQYRISSHPAYVVVQSETRPDWDHALYWDGNKIWDPSPSSKDGRHPSTYKVKMWIPIYRVE